MLSEFRVRYPHGSLISELLMLEQGKYLVRALVQNEGVTLATGLAAAETVEQAEDRARSRALAALGIERESTLTPAPAVSETTDSDLFSKPASISSSSEPLRSSEPESSDFSHAQNNFVEAAQPTPASTETQPLWWEEEQPPQEIAKAEESRSPTRSSKRKKAANTQPLSPSSPSEPGEAVSHPTSDSSAPLDYSDIIAKTNVELKRLRWTNEQGRKFLEEHYGKRSRQLLDHAELLEFLHYLESQPTPP